MTSKEGLDKEQLELTLKDRMNSYKGIVKQISVADPYSPVSYMGKQGYVVPISSRSGGVAGVEDKTFGVQRGSVYAKNEKVGEFVSDSEKNKPVEKKKVEEIEEDKEQEEEKIELKKIFPAVIKTEFGRFKGKFNFVKESVDDKHLLVMAYPQDSSVFIPPVTDKPVTIQDLCSNKLYTVYYKGTNFEIEELNLGFLVFEFKEDQ